MTDELHIYKEVAAAIQEDIPHNGELLAFPTRPGGVDARYDRYNNQVIIRFSFSRTDRHGLVHFSADRLPAKWSGKLSKIEEGWYFF